MYKLYFYNHLSLYIYIILYIDACLSLSLSVFSLVSIVTKPYEAQVSQNLSVTASSAGGHGLCYLGILQELQGLCRACEGLRLSGQHNMSHHTSTHRRRSLSCQHFASRQRPSAFIFQLFILEGFGASVGTHSKPVYRMPEHIEADTKTTGPH